jgi:opacity protein-like surface antigen
MSVRKCFAIASLVLLSSVAVPSKASADWLLTPFVGWNFGGKADFLSSGGGDFEEEFDQRANFGVSLAWMGAGVIGFEADLGYSPNFFESAKGTGNFLEDSSVTTLMGNLVIGVPIGGQSGVGFRPYVVGGVGLMKATADDPFDIFNVDSNSFGFDVGGGAMFFFSDKFGIRGDLRYFRSLEDADLGSGLDFDFGALKFWRGSIGATFRF